MTITQEIGPFLLFLKNKITAVFFKDLFFVSLSLNGMLCHSFATLEGEHEFLLQFPPLLNIMMLSSLIQAEKGGCGILQLPTSILILNMRGLFEENPIMKNCAITLIIGKN